LNKGQTLLFIEKCDVYGLHKAAALRAYYNEYFRKHPDADVEESNILKLSKNTPKEIRSQKNGQ